MMQRLNHTFAICAYGQSPYLRECIESVLNQTKRGSEVYIATSTPSEWLDNLAAEYGLSVFKNEGETGIGQDWNHAYSYATTDFVTIVHQDDTYQPEYCESALELLEASKNPIIFFSDYGEIRNDERVNENDLLKTKRKMLAPIKNGRMAGSRFVRRRILSLGSPICCPSVTLARAACGDKPYKTEMECSLDWDTWETLSRLDGDFLYSPKLLMYHRIHEESATSALIENNTRFEEDAEMFRRFWPAGIAAAISRAYAKSEDSNSMD